MKHPRIVSLCCALVLLCGVAAFASFAAPGAHPAPPAQAKVVADAPVDPAAPAASFGPDMTPMTACQGVTCDTDCDCKQCCEDGGYSLYHCGATQHKCLCG